MYQPFTPADLPPPTHSPVDMGNLFGLCREIMTQAQGQEVEPWLLERIADDHDLPRAYAYAALQFNPMLRLKRTHEVALGICTGRCQLWGGFDLLERALALRDARAAEGKPGFDVVPQGCLNLCEKPPMVVTASPDGVAAVPSATSGGIAAAVQMLFGEG